jgi:hypothetical protein
MMEQERMPAVKGPRSYETQEAIAGELGLTPRTLKRWRSEGSGPPYVRISRQRVVYPRAEFERWLLDRLFRSRAAELARNAGA